MIPKVIHYCWFGKGKKPYLIRKCIRSWHKILPDFEFKEWNETNFDINICPFVRQAYDEKNGLLLPTIVDFMHSTRRGGIFRY